MAEWSKAPASGAGPSRAWVRIPLLSFFFASHAYYEWLSTCRDVGRLILKQELVQMTNDKTEIEV